MTDPDQLIKSDISYLVRLEKSFRTLLSTSHMVEPVLRKSTKSKKHKKLKILFIAKGGPLADFGKIFFNF